MICELAAALSNFWVKLGPLLEQVKANTAPTQHVEDLKQTSFSNPAMLSWLSATVVEVSNGIFKACQKELDEAWATAEQLETLLGKLPAPSNEEEYRSEGTKLTKQLADLVAKVGKHEKLRLKGVSALKLLAENGLPGNPSDNSPNALFQKFQGGEDGFNAKVLKSCACASVHVAMVAGLCLLRNSALGTAKDEGKMILSQLGGVAVALKSKVEALQLCAEPDKQLLAKAESVLQEVAAAQEPNAAAKANPSSSKATEKRKKEEKEKEKKEKDKDKKDKKAKKEESAKGSKNKAVDEQVEGAEPPAKKARGRGRGRG